MNALTEYSHPTLAGAYMRGAAEETSPVGVIMTDGSGTRPTTTSARWLWAS